MRSTLAWAPTLFDDAGDGGSSPTPAADATFRGLRRRELEHGAWVDHQAGWLSGSAPLFDELVEGLDWRQPEVPMYGQLVRQPRRSAWLRLDELPEHLPTARRVLPELRRLLGERYGRRFATVGANLYRDGADSVAWHGDRVRRERTSAVIAIVSLGAARPFRLRPRQGGRSIGFELGHGDLLVMGGTCQRSWQHAVPKRRGSVGPRLSVTFRHAQPGAGIEEWAP